MARAPRGSETTRHKKTQVALDDVEYKQLQRIKEHYNIKEDAHLIRALIKQASLSIMIKSSTS